MNKLLAVSIGDTFNGSNPLLSEVGNINKITTSLINGAIAVSGVILLFLLIFGGIGIISGAGKNDPKAVEQGKKTVTSALIGFIVVFASYWIVKLVELITGLKLL